MPSRKYVCAYILTWVSFLATTDILLFHTFPLCSLRFSHFITFLCLNSHRNEKHEQYKNLNMGIKQHKATKIPNEMLINVSLCNMQKTDQRSDHSVSDQGSMQANILPPTGGKSKDQGKTVTVRQVYLTPSPAKLSRL